MEKKTRLNGVCITNNFVRIKKKKNKIKRKPVDMIITPSLLRLLTLCSAHAQCGYGLINIHVWNYFVMYLHNVIIIESKHVENTRIVPKFFNCADDLLESRRYKLQQFLLIYVLCSKLTIPLFNGRILMLINSSSCLRMR